MPDGDGAPTSMLALLKNAEYPKGGCNHPAKVTLAIKAAPTRMAFAAYTWTCLSLYKLSTCVATSGLSSKVLTVSSCFISVAI